MKTIKNITKLAFIAILMAAFTANAQSTQTAVTKTIKMLDFLDAAVIEANQAAGGLHTVANEAALANITDERVVKGMLAVVENGAIYRFDGVTGTNSADWTKLVTIAEWNVANAASYDIGVTTFFNGMIYVSLKDDNGDTPGTDPTWRKIGDVNFEKDVANKAALVNTNKVKGDIATVLDVDGNNANGFQKGTYIFDGADWQPLFEQVDAQILSGNDFAARLTATKDANPGDIYVVTDIDPTAGNGNQKGIYVRNNTYTAVQPADAAADKAFWVALSEEVAPGTVTDDNKDFIYYAKITTVDKATAEAAMIAGNQVAGGKVDTYQKALGALATENFMMFAYPADWTGNPLFFIDPDGTGTIFNIKDCWTVFEVEDAAGRRFKAWVSDVKFPAAAEFTVK